MTATNIHPNLVKRPQRARGTMVGRTAYYIPRSIAVNTNILIGSKVTILEFEHKGGKDLSLVLVRTASELKETALFSDLAFIR
jgi:hypothetical protein